MVIAGLPSVWLLFVAFVPIKRAVEDQLSRMLYRYSHRNSHLNEDTYLPLSIERLGCLGWPGCFFIYYQSSQVKSNWAELVDVSELKVKELIFISSKCSNMVHTWLDWHMKPWQWDESDTLLAKQPANTPLLLNTPPPSLPASPLCPSSANRSALHGQEQQYSWWDEELDNYNC